MVSVMSSSSYIASASCYHPQYQSRCSMYIHGLIPLNFTELAKAVLIDLVSDTFCMYAQLTNRARALYFGLSLHLHPYFMYVASEGSGESVHLHRLT